MGPRVSVVIPVYNGEAYLEQALQSVFSQYRRPEQVVIVDDGSIDGTAAIAHAFPAAKYLHQPNQGISSALNLGIRSATGDIVTFLDADDFWAVDTLEQQCTLLEKHPEKQIVIGRVQPIKMKPTSAEKKELVRIGAPEFLLNLGSAFFRKDVFASVGMMDETMVTAADWDWFLRAREEGVPVLTHPGVVLFYRRHESNITNKKKQLDHDLLVMFKKTLDRRRKQGMAGELPRLADFLVAARQDSFFPHDPIE